MRKIDDFFSKYPLRQFDQGQILLFPRDELRHIYYLKEGTVDEYDITPAGNKIIVNIFKPPAFFPMSWAINETRNAYFFEASSNVTAVIAPPADVIEFLKANNDVLFDLLARVYKGTDVLLKRIALSSGSDALSKLAFELLVECRRFGEKEKGLTRINVSQNELASRAGLARETVSRELKVLKEDGAIELSRHGITIKNKVLLERKLED